MQTQFKAGDRVEILNNAGFKWGTVVGKSTAYSDMTEVRPDGRDERPYHFFTDNLKLISSGQPHDFKVGDRVRGLNSWRNREAGSVLRISYSWVHVRWDDFNEYRSDTDTHSVDKRDLVLLSPHSPQPQQNQQPKEESMYPYIVLFHNLAGTSQASVHSHHVTEEQAKQQAEALVAQQRADLTKKQYFTVTIVNTKTGELVGSVSDAPPAVDWAKK